MPSNLKLYDGSTDPDDHITRFCGAANHGNWPMPVWCLMFQQTLDDAARGWFDRLPNGTIDSWEALRSQFVSRFALRRKCVKSPMEITKIVRLANESLPEFKERWTDEASHISGVPELMQISSFINGSKCPELAKRFSDRVPQTVAEMMIRVDDFVRAEAVYRSTELPRGERSETYRKDWQSTPPGDRYPRGTYGTDRKRSNFRRDVRVGRNDHYAPYIPRNENRRDPYRNGNHQTDARPEGRRDDTRPLDLNLLSKAPREILATERQLHLPPPPPLKGRPARENLDIYYDYHGKEDT